MEHLSGSKFKITLSIVNLSDRKHLMTSHWQCRNWYWIKKSGKLSFADLCYRVPMYQGCPLRYGFWTPDRLGSECAKY